MRRSPLTRFGPDDNVDGLRTACDSARTVTIGQGRTLGPKSGVSKPNDSLTIRSGLELGLVVLQERSELGI